MNGIVHTRASISRYLPWMLRDYSTNQGPATLIVMLLIGYAAIQPAMRAAASGVLGEPEMTEELVLQLLRSFASPLAFLGTLFATNGIIANDRKLGFYRFLFSKPLNPLAYYTVTFAVYGIGLLIVTTLLVSVAALALEPVFPVELFLVIAWMYLAYGGVGFLLSAAWRFDWLSLVTVVLGSNIAWRLWGESDSPLRVLLYLLPPFHRESRIYDWIGRPEAEVPWSIMLWIGGYGVACLLLGLVVLRKRPLGTS